MFIFKCSDCFVNVFFYFANLKPNILRISRIKKKQGGSKRLVMTVTIEVITANDSKLVRYK